MTAFFALHPYLLWTSLEIRVYALVVLLSILLLKFFVAGFCENENRRTAQILYGVTAIIALYTNYYLGFLLVGNFAALVVGRRWQSAKSYFRQMLIVGAVFAPLAVAVDGAVRGEFRRSSRREINRRRFASFVEHLSHLRFTDPKLRRRTIFRRRRFQSCGSGWRVC